MKPHPCNGTRGVDSDRIDSHGYSRSLVAAVSLDPFHYLAHAEVQWFDTKQETFEGEIGRNLLGFMALGYRVKMLVDAKPDFAALYREIGPRLWRAILAYSGGRRDVADDAVGEAFVRAMESQKPIRSPYPWLYRTAFRIAAADLRRDLRNGPEEGAYVDDPATGDLMRAMRQLPPKARAAIYLHYQADLPIREVARLTDSSVAAVKVQLHRGRNRLRELLGAEETDHD